MPVWHERCISFTGLDSERLVWAQSVAPGLPHLAQMPAPLERLRWLRFQTRHCLLVYCFGRTLTGFARRNLAERDEA
jgi:hypothetical protein